MASPGVKKQNQLLEPLIGEWRMAMGMPGQEVPDELPDIGARVTFEWMGEQAFVLERWRVPIPGAPNGLAVLGWDEGRGTFLQHYFDERGVARVYEMSLKGGVEKGEQPGLITLRVLPALHRHLQRRRLADRRHLGNRRRPQDLEEGLRPDLQPGLAPALPNPRTPEPAEPATLFLLLRRGAACTGRIVERRLSDPGATDGLFARHE